MYNLCPCGHGDPCLPDYHAGRKTNLGSARHAACRRHSDLVLSPSPCFSLSFSLLGRCYETPIHHGRRCLPAMYETHEPILVRRRGVGGIITN